MSPIDTLLDTYGLTYICYWTGHDRRAMKKHLRGAHNPAITATIDQMHAAHQAGDILVQHLDTHRVGNNQEHMTHTEGELLRHVYTLTNAYGTELAAQLCDTPRQHLSALLNGKRDQVTLPLAHRIIDAHQAHIEGRVEIVEVAA